MLIWLIVVCLPALAQQPAARVRTIRQVAGTPLTSLLLPDDETVVVERPGTPPLVLQVEPNLTPEQAVAFATSYSDAIVVMDVQTSIAALVEDGSWIATHTTGQVVDVVKPFPRRPLRIGQRLVLTQDGGELLGAVMWSLAEAWAAIGVR